MKASKVSRDTLERAADEIGVTLEMSTLNTRGTIHRVKLNPQTSESLYRPPCKKHRDGTWRGVCRCRRWSDERGDTKYQRTSARGNDARVHAVCWHGFRDFFRAVYRIEPDAVFATAFDTWCGSEDFEARFRESGHKNIGSQMCPVAAAEACRCPESGHIDRAPSRFDNPTFSPFETSPHDTYGADEADGAACRAMATALRAARG